MPGKKIKKAKSDAQARLFGAIAGGAHIEGISLSKKDARKKLKGVKLKELPEHLKKVTHKRSSY